LGTMSPARRWQASVATELRKAFLRIADRRVGGSFSSLRTYPGPHGGAPHGGAERGGAGRGGTVIVKKKVTSPKKGGRRREPGLFRPHPDTATEPVGVAGCGQRDRGPWREVRRPPRSLGGDSASGTLARFELSAQARRRSEGLAPAASHPPPQPSKRSVAFRSHLKGLYGGLHFTLALLLYYYPRRRSPAPPFPPDHRQAGERGAIKTFGIHVR
jgi:hypothetical protein